MSEVDRYGSLELGIRKHSIILWILLIIGTTLPGSLEMDEAVMDVGPAPAEGDASNSEEIKAEKTDIEKTDGDYEFATTLEGFEYAFNDKGQLRHKKTGEEFVFKIKDFHVYNQKRYEALGEIVTEYVYELLEKEVNLKRTYLPVDAEEDEPRSFIFMSDDALTNEDKLLLLIHGSGVVRAGQWARRLIINDCLDSGTQIPFIKKAVADGYGVIVLNTNLNKVKKSDGTMVPIRESGNPEDHAEYVWRHFVRKAAAKAIAVIAHSYGGIVTTDLLGHQESDFRQRVFAIALTDSVHSLQHQDLPESASSFFEEIAQNWVSSDEPLDTAMPSFVPDCPLVSAGHLKHEYTSWSSFESIMRFLEERYKRNNVKTAVEFSESKEEL